MANIRLIHWKPAEALEIIELLRAAGHEVAYDEQINPGVSRQIHEKQPDAIVIDLSRLPSHGREVAVYLRGHKATRDIPLVFTGGAEEKVAAIRELLPDATYSTSRQLKSAIRSALKPRTGAAPIVPLQMMDRYAGRTPAQKMGIQPHTTAAVYDAPRGYAQALGQLPEGVTIHEEPAEPCAVTIWFAHNPEDFLAALPKLKRIAVKTKLWVAWKKKSAAPTSRISEDFVRNAAINAGLVDYKVCAIDSTWSGLALAQKRTRFAS